MKYLTICGALFTVMLSTGCVTTSYSKSISVTKDADGKILQTVETEGVVQPDQKGWPLKLNYLKGIKPGE
jgi:hypothetical protein